MRRLAAMVLCLLMAAMGMAYAEEEGAADVEGLEGFDVMAVLEEMGLDLDSIVVQPAVTEEYWNLVTAGGDIEAKYAALGEYSVKKVVVPVDDPQVVDYVIVYPEALETGDAKWPMVVFVNGSNDTTQAHYNTLYHLATHGFIVVGNEDQGSGSGQTTSDMLDYMLAENGNESSFLYGKIDVDHIGLTGGSQGACGAVRAATKYENSGMYKALVTLSLPRIEIAENMVPADWTYDTSELKIPLLMMSGTGFADSNEFNPISPLSSMEINYDNMPDEIPCAMGRRIDADHTDMMVVGDGYLTAWFCCFLKGDTEALKAFGGESAEMLNNTTNWQDVRIKNFE